MKTPLSHLHRNRFGTFYFRITIGGKTVKRSLKTKLPELATMRVAVLNWQWSNMKQPNEPSVADIIKALKSDKGRKFDATFPDGTASSASPKTANCYPNRCTCGGGPKQRRSTQAALVVAGNLRQQARVLLVKAEQIRDPLRIRL